MKKNLEFRRFSTPSPGLVVLTDSATGSFDNGLKCEIKYQKRCQSIQTLLTLSTKVLIKILLSLKNMHTEKKESLFEALLQ